MNLLKWNIVEKKEKAPRRMHSAFASVGRNSLTLSAGAAMMISGHKDYSYAELLTADDGRNRYIGIRLTKSQTENSLPIKRRVSRGKEVNGITISNRQMLAEAFGRNISEKNGVTRFDVCRDKNYSNILMIPLGQNEKKASKQGKFGLQNLYY